MHSGALMQILPHKFEQQQSRLSFTFESSLTPSLNAIFFNTQNILDSSLKHYPYSETLFRYNSLVSVMISLIASSAVDHGFDSWSGKTKDFKMSIF
jgi:hypothetical protein